MPRVKRGKTKTKKREKLLKQVKGFKWGRKNKKRAAKEAILHKYANAYKGRKEKKRDFRKLWNVRINAAARKNGTKYSDLIHALKENKVEIDRKVLAEIAKDEPKVFEKIVESVK